MERLVLQLFSVPSARTTRYLVGLGTALIEVSDILKTGSTRYERIHNILYPFIDDQIGSDPPHHFSDYKSLVVADIICVFLQVFDTSDVEMFIEMFGLWGTYHFGRITA
jgi:hypothetical protein